MEGRGGRPEGYCHRVMLDAVFYVDDNGIKWRNMPVDFPAWDRVYRLIRPRMARAARPSNTGSARRDAISV
ncbi:transposase [Streptomyces sp. NPDC050844]|uniref:transposase n=1 Tax=Streptomyces sp. NPDC050844 TaxID=3155790 RepID=UPI0033DE4496